MRSVRDKPGQLGSVLCIDDEEDLQSIIRISLERLGGIKAHFCTDPEHAMARVREVRPDLILLDLLMPRLDGATLFRRLQADPELAPIPVVFLTAVMTGPEARKLSSLGAAAILVKPFDVVELPRKLSAIWNALNISGPAELPQRLRSRGHRLSAPAALAWRQIVAQALHPLPGVLGRVQVRRRAGRRTRRRPASSWCLFLPPLPRLMRACILP